jgi:hypothetical protein
MPEPIELHPENSVLLRKLQSISPLSDEEKHSPSSTTSEAPA